MRKLLILLAVLSAAIICAMPFLCAHPDILPEVSTAYYDYKAKEEALTATGPEAELMRMLTGLSADTELEPVTTPLSFSEFGLRLAFGAFLCSAFLLLIWRKHPDLDLALRWTCCLAVPFGLIGARLVYALVNISFYLGAIAAPEAMLKIWEGGLSLSGALMFIMLAGVLGTKLGKSSVLRVLDALVVPLTLLALYVNMAVSSIDMGFGPEISGSFMAITIGSANRLDTGYVAVLSLLVLLLALVLFKRRSTLPDGTFFALYAFLYGTVMILLESLRKDGHMVWGFVHAEMVFDLVFALLGLICLARTKRRILLSLLLTAIMAGAVVALEFALDRSAIGDGLLYAAYVAVLCAYIAWGCTCAKRRLAV